MVIDRVELCFRLLGVAGTPEEIQRVLPIAPTRVYKNESASVSQVRPRTVWVLESASKSENPADHILSLLEMIEPHRAQICELLREGWEADFFIGLFLGDKQGGPYFSPSLLRRVADLGAAVSLDIYARK